MKLSNVIVLSIVGMLATSLSVLLFTSRPQASPDDLTSNELGLRLAHKPSTTPKLNLILEPDAVASMTTPRPNSPGQTAPSAAYDGNDDEKIEEKQGPLQLTSEDEPCSFSIDGKPVTIIGNVPLMVRIGPHKVKCERPNGEVIETQVDVVEGVLSPVSF
ncbi:MAG TPA: hypothetical protein PK156_27710 [Polyangium sp.]|nr:hypothetical protein [Polyangium sp.]